MNRTVAILALALVACSKHDATPAAPPSPNQPIAAPPPATPPRGLAALSKDQAAAPPTPPTEAPSAPTEAPAEPPTETPTEAPTAPAEPRPEPSPPPARAVDLAIVRSFDALADNSAVTPRPLSVGGDYVEFDRAARCGFLSYESRPGADDGAYFILCKGQPVAGPLTTAAQIREVTAALAARESQRHQLMQNIISQYPIAAAHYRVYDQGGVLVHEQ